MTFHQKLFVFAAIAASSLLASINAQAAQIQQCENMSRPIGYLTVEANILSGNCPTRKAIRYRTPEENLTIIKPQELPSLSEPWVVISANDSLGANANYRIAAARDGIVACAIPGTYRPAGYFSLPAGRVGGCGNSGGSVDNALTHYKIVITDIVKSAGTPASIKVTLNPKNPERTLNYVIRVSADLNGTRTTVSKQGLTGSGSYTLNTLAPSLVPLAQQNAYFTFETEVFALGTSLTKSLNMAYGLELLGQ
ncbi:hypothetical protein NLK61_06830 [Pseudomonas fuscovaginae UPB0736]|uniref:hypothetical protein n=1 Tax=Pseudomonas asplenii TaxID=53407 RepID=UPI000288F352|nr:hypothetical protein [Pseudomonas fuscovaginae]UUQ66351.1 hypothetical protein NLK61_06830 [Pseudomonas fuscovaginae UPB0736]